MSDLGHLQAGNFQSIERNVSASGCYPEELGTNNSWAQVVPMQVRCEASFEVVMSEVQCMLGVEKPLG